MAPSAALVAALAPEPAPAYPRLMSVVAFDTHAAVTALREAGFDERQAEGVVATVRDAVAEGVATRADVDRLEDKMATKADVARLENEMATKADLAEVKADVAEVKADVAEVKVDFARLEGRIERVENEMATKSALAEVKSDVARLETRMYVAMLTAVGAVVALVKLLP